MLPPPPARRGGSAEGPPLREPLAADSRGGSDRRRLPSSPPLLDRPQVCAHLSLTDTQTNRVSPLGLEMGRWAQKVCHQQKRTDGEDMTDRLEGEN